MQQPQSTVLVVGATGYAGRYIVARLHNAGYGIRAVVRNKQRALAPGQYGAPKLDGLVDDWVVTTNGFDLDASIMDGIDHVVSALGVTRQRTDPWDIDFRLNLQYLQLAEHHALQSFLYLGVMHANRGTSAISRAKHAFMEVLSRSDVPSQIINPSAYFSDMTEIFHQARRGVAIGIGNGATRLTPIHGADLADFCVATLPGPEGTWNVGGPEVLTYRQIVRAVFAAVGRQERSLSIPGAVASSAIWLTARISPRVASLGRFLVETLQTDTVGQPYGQHTISDYFAELAS